MGAEQAQWKETLGIQVPLAPTLILAAFRYSHLGPHKETTYVDVTGKNTAAWLTTPGSGDDDRIDFIIGPHGLASPIGVLWDEQGPLFGYRTEMDFEAVDEDIEPDIQIAGLPEGEKGFVLGKKYPNYIEEYTVFRIPPKGELTLQSFAPFITEHQLMSGFKNRGRASHIATSIVALRMTDGKYELPFGQVLRPPKPPRRNLFNFR